MSNRPMAKRDTAQFLHTHTPAIMGDQVERSVILQQRLTEEALRCRNSVMAKLFKPELTDAVRTTEKEIVIEQLESKQEVLRYLNEAGLTMLRTSLEQVLICYGAESLGNTYSRLFARRQSLEAELTITWQRFCASAQEESAWAASMPPFIRITAEKKIQRSIDNFFSMMSAMLDAFGALVHQKIGRD